MEVTALPSALVGVRFMSARNDRETHDWSTSRNPHDRASDPSKLDFKDTILELAMTLGGIVGVFFLLIALVKAFGW